MLLPFSRRRRLVRSSLVLGLLTSAAMSGAACGDDDSGKPPALTDVDATRKLSLFADTTSVPADSVSVATITVTGSTRGPIQISTSKGELNTSAGSRGPSVSIPADGVVTLKSNCIGDLDPVKCGGTATVEAVDAAAAKGSIKITLAVKENCTNKTDDDGDGLVDCADKDSCVLGTLCGGGFACGSTGECNVCSPGVGKKVETAESTCEDSADNDCDGKVDCADSDCADKPCALAAGGLGRCFSGTCTCAGAVEICGNKLDDDCDGKNDCDDPDCQPGGKLAEQPCDAVGHTCSDKPDAKNDKCNLCGKNVTTETTCGDAKDDDCDGKIDCEDADCNAQSCGASPGQICNAGKCVDTSTSYVLKLTAERPSIPANGKATDVITVKITSDGKAPVENQVVDLLLEGKGKFSGSGDAGKTQVKTNAAGEAQVTVIGTGDAGFIKVRGTHTQTGNTAEVNVTVPSLASVSLTQVQYPIMGVKTSGFQEQSKLVYTLVGSDGQPYPAGLDVTFEHEPKGKSSIGVGGIPQASCGAAGCTVSVATVSKEDGKAEVSLYSGTVADVVSVRFKAEAAGQPTTFEPPQSIAVVGARANWYNMSVACSPGNVPALVETTCTDSLIDEEIKCTVILADRFKNKLGLAKIANFRSEAGVVGPPPTTPAYDPAKKPADQPALGRAEGTINTVGVLPKDVPPQADEYSAQYTDTCGDLTHNPRDGIVSIIAAVIGEEGFIDINGDGLYTDGEPFVDLGEPFIDANDDGVHQDDEVFVDTDSSGKWTPPNGKWDDNTTIWTETRVTFSGPPRDAATAGKDGFSRWLVGTGGPVSPPAPTDTPAPIKLAFKELRSVGLLFTDGNFNPPGVTTTYADPVVTGEGVSTKVDPPVLPVERVEGHFLKQEFCDDTGTTCGAVCPPAPGVTRCLARNKVTNYTHFSSGAVGLTGGTTAGNWAVGVTAKTTAKKPGSVVTKSVKIGISGSTAP